MAALRIIDARHEIVAEERRAGSNEAFDRLAFASRALSVLRPRRMTVMVYPGARELRVETGRDLARGPGATWALVGIPDHASREHIALCLADLGGAPPPPFALDLLLAAPLGAPL